VNAVEFAFSDYLRDRYRNRYLFEERLKDLLENAKDRDGASLFARWLDGERPMTCGKHDAGPSASSGLRYLTRRRAAEGVTLHGLRTWLGVEGVGTCDVAGLEELRRHPSRVIERGETAAGGIDLKDRKRCPPDPRTVAALFLGVRGTLPFPELSRALRVHYSITDDVATAPPPVTAPRDEAAEATREAQALEAGLELSDVVAEEVERRHVNEGVWAAVWAAVEQALRPAERLIFLLSEDHLLYLLLAGLPAQRIGEVLTESAAYLRLIGEGEKIDLTDLRPDRPLDRALRKALIPAASEGTRRVRFDAVGVEELNTILTGLLCECGCRAAADRLDVRHLAAARPEEQMVAAALAEAGCPLPTEGSPVTLNAAQINQVVTLLARRLGRLSDVQRLDITCLDEARSPDAEMKRALDHARPAPEGGEGGDTLSQGEIAAALGLKDASRVRDALFDARKKIRAAGGGSTLSTPRPVVPGRSCDE
jgi:hypothetical protein